MKSEFIKYHIRKASAGNKPLSFLQKRALEEAKKKRKFVICNDYAGVNMEELLYKKDVLDLVKDDAYFVNETNNLITFPMEEILKRMWNCRGKETTSIDKVKMEMIIKDVLKEYSPTNETKAKV